jgi:hypothetical protein
MVIMAISIGIGIWDLGKNFTGDYGNYGYFYFKSAQSAKFAVKFAMYLSPPFNLFHLL